MTDSGHILSTDSIKVVAFEHRQINKQQRINTSASTTISTSSNRSSVAHNTHLNDEEEEDETEALIRNTKWEDD